VGVVSFEIWHIEGERLRGEVNPLLIKFSSSSIVWKWYIPGHLLCIMSINQSINQSISLFVQKCNTHWTGHQGRMQPPLTGAYKTKLVRATNDNT